MKLSLAINPFTDERLRMAAQLGIEGVTYYNMQGMPMALEELQEAQVKARRNGVSITVVEGGPPIGHSVAGRPERDTEIEAYQNALRAMGETGISTLCYNFMPQVTEDAMVIRTSRQTPERGGALTTAFNLETFEKNPLQHDEPDLSDSEAWDHFFYFLDRVLPVAEDAGVNLALHPADPPISPLCGLARIGSSIDDYEKLFSAFPSPSNGMTFCQGCFGELGADLPDLIRHFGPRIHYAHFRDIRGSLHDFVETFPDNGQTDLLALFQAYREIGYTGFLRPDHAPQLATESGENHGYGIQGHIFTLGYLKGWIDAL